MAEVSICFACNNFDWDNSICQITSDRPAKDIFLEIKPCSNYKQLPDKCPDMDLPIAKGR